MNKFVIWFTKITAILVQWICFRRKTYYINKENQNRKIKGKAILISNHTSVYDFALYLFLFYNRTLRFLMAEILFERSSLLKWFLNCFGGIKVNRDVYDFSFIGEAMEILEDGVVVGIFPESRLPKPGEERPLPFKPSAAYLAIKSGAPVIPVYTDGSYFKKKRAHVIIGEKIYLRDLWDDNKSEKENLSFMTDYLREVIVSLGDTLNECKQKKRKKKTHHEDI